MLEARGVSDHDRVSGPGRIARVRSWWDQSSFLGEVALLFALITVGNSVMMLTGLDEPKTGTFAYVHLLGRLGIVVVLVGLFHLDEAGDLMKRWRGLARRAARTDRDRSRRPVGRAVAGFFLRGWVEGTARVFTTVVVAACLVAVAVSGIWPVAGGAGLYRALVLLAVLLVLVVFVAGRWWRQQEAEA